MFVRTSVGMIVNLSHHPYISILHNSETHEYDCSVYVPRNPFPLRLFDGTREECENVVDSIWDAMFSGWGTLNMMTWVGTKREEQNNE